MLRPAVRAPNGRGVAPAVRHRDGLGVAEWAEEEAWEGLGLAPDDLPPLSPHASLCASALYISSSGKAILGAQAPYARPMRIEASGISLGVIISSHALAARVVERARGMGFRVIWATGPSELPITVRHVVMSRSSGGEAPEARRIHYVEDYPSIDCLLMHIVAEERGRARHRSLAAAVDPGRSIGAAFFADEALIATSTYTSLDAFIEEYRRVEECLGAGRRREVYVGYTPSEEAYNALQALRSALRHAKVMPVPEEETASPETRGALPKDEREALRIYYRAKSLGIG